jgi:hypothetical protein
MLVFKLPGQAPVGLTHGVFQGLDKLKLCWPLRRLPELIKVETTFSFSRLFQPST